METINRLDEDTSHFLEWLFSGSSERRVDPSLAENFKGLLEKSLAGAKTGNIIELFKKLQKARLEEGLSPLAFGIARDSLAELACKHENIDEHGVTLAGRAGRAAGIVDEAKKRVEKYLEENRALVPSGIELWDKIRENHSRIKGFLKMNDEEWNSFPGQMKNALESPDALAGLLNLPAEFVEEMRRVTRKYRMRITPYYAGLIMPGNLKDPVLLQSIPTAEMLYNCGVEIPPVAADHSPARLIDQFYPRVVSIKATNMCAMYCTHCLRIAHIGKKDRIYPKEAYREAFDYIRSDPAVRDVLITGGDAFMLPNEMIEWILAELDGIEHVRVKRLGTRTPVTTPQRVETQLLDILAASNDKKPLRVVTQINTAQEITPVSYEALKAISKSVFALLNQAVLLRGVNDTRTMMWKLSETIQEAYVRPYYVFNCSYRNPQFAHLRVPVGKGLDIIESMYGNISGDAIPRYIATAGGKIPLQRSNIIRRDGHDLVLKKPWSGEETNYPDAGPIE